MKFNLDFLKPKIVDPEDLDDYDDLEDEKRKKWIKIAIIASIVLFIVILIVVIKTSIDKKNEENEASRITEFVGYNDNEYDNDELISVKDFDFTIIHANGYEEKPNYNDIKLSQEYVNRIGATTTIEATIVIDRKTYTCDVDVRAARAEVEAFECGYPNLSDVRAVVYSNGELCFEGKGNIITYVNNRYPWLNERSEEQIPIKSITFAEGVEPICLDNYFINLDTLEFVGRIPDSVVTMTGTFQNCSNLKNGANWTQCKNLTNINSCYQGCTSLIYCPAIPQYVRTANDTFKDCTSLEVSPDFEYAVSITDAMSIFEGCISLHDGVNIPPCALNVSYMYKNCINLHKMPEIPIFTINMTGTFEGCVNMEELTPIPSNVEIVDSCFNGCKFMNGELIVNANPYSYRGFLSGTAESVDLNLTGDSLMLDVLANTGSGYITVNGNEADPFIVDREQVIYEE